MKRALLKIAAGLLRAAYLPIRPRRVRDRISIISRQGDRESLDISMLRRELEKNHPEFEVVVMTKTLKPGIAGKFSYIFHLLEQMKAIASSKAVLVDGYCISVSVLKHKKETVFIQMWHALAAVKKFGFQTVGKFSGSDPDTAEIMCMHRNYHHVLCAGKRSVPYFCEGFNISEDRIEMMGLPRIDYIKEPLEGQEAEKIRERLRIGRGRKSVLYAPTFRKGRTVKLEELADAAERAEINLVVKLHPLDSAALPPMLAAKASAAEGISTYDLMKCCDAIVTDYSALDVEGLLAEKPMYFYTYDIEEYRKDPGLNIDIEEELKKYTFRDPEELMNEIKKPYDFSGLNRFREGFITVETENCTGKLAEYIADLARSDKKHII